MEPEAGFMNTVTLFACILQSEILNKLNSMYLLVLQVKHTSQTCLLELLKTE